MGWKGPNIGPNIGPREGSSSNVLLLFSTVLVVVVVVAVVVVVDEDDLDEEGFEEEKDGFEEDEAEEEEEEPSIAIECAFLFDSSACFFSSRFFRFLSFFPCSCSNLSFSFFSSSSATFSGGLMGMMSSFV